MCYFVTDPILPGFVVIVVVVVVVVVAVKSTQRNSSRLSQRNKITECPKNKAKQLVPDAKERSKHAISQKNF